MQFEKSEQKLFFKPRTGSLNWGALLDVDLDTLARNVDVDILQAHLENITFSDISQRDLPYLTKSNFIHLFRFSQLIVEYLVNVQDFLMSQQGAAATEKQELEQALNMERARLEAYKKKMEAKLGKVKHLKKTLAYCKKTIKVYESGRGPKTKTHFACALCQFNGKTRDEVIAHSNSMHSRREVEERLTKEKDDALKQLSSTTQAQERKMGEWMKLWESKISDGLDHKARIHDLEVQASKTAVEHAAEIAALKQQLAAALAKLDTQKTELTTEQAQGVEVRGELTGVQKENERLREQLLADKAAWQNAESLWKSSQAQAARPQTRTRAVDLDFGAFGSGEDNSEPEEKKEEPEEEETKEPVVATRALDLGDLNGDEQEQDTKPEVTRDSSLLRNGRHRTFEKFPTIRSRHKHRQHTLKKFRDLVAQRMSGIYKDRDRQDRLGDAVEQEHTAHLEIVHTYTEDLLAGRLPQLSSIATSDPELDSEPDDLVTVDEPVDEPEPIVVAVVEEAKAEAVEPEPVVETPVLEEEEEEKKKKKTVSMKDFNSRVITEKLKAERKKQQEEEAHAAAVKAAQKKPPLPKRHSMSVPHQSQKPLVPSKTPLVSPKASAPEPEPEPEVAVDEDIDVDDLFDVLDPLVEAAADESEPEDEDVSGSVGPDAADVLADLISAALPSVDEGSVLFSEPNDGDSSAWNSDSEEEDAVVEVDDLISDAEEDQKSSGGGSVLGMLQDIVNNNNKKPEAEELDESSAGEGNGSLVDMLQDVIDNQDKNPRKKKQRKQDQEESGSVMDMLAEIVEEDDEQSQKKTNNRKKKQEDNGSVMDMLQDIVDVAAEEEEQSESELEDSSEPELKSRKDSSADDFMASILNDVAGLAEDSDASPRHKKKHKKKHSPERKRQKPQQSYEELMQSIVAEAESTQGRPLSPASAALARLEHLHDSTPPPADDEDTVEFSEAESEVDEGSAVMCDVCDDVVAEFFCKNCNMNFCAEKGDSCDADYHVSSRRNHERIPL